MDRRTFLGTGATLLGASVAGCEEIGGRTVTLGDPEEETRDGGQRTYLTYRHDGERIVSPGFIQRNVPAAAGEPFGVRVTMPHSEETTIDSFRVDMRAPRTPGTGPTAEVYLAAPGGVDRWSELNFQQVEDQWTRISLSETGDLGEGTISFDTIIDPFDGAVETVGIRLAVTLSTGRGVPGRTYRLDTLTGVAPVTAEQ